MSLQKKANGLYENVDTLLKMVAENAELAEGKEGVRLILREIYQHSPIGTKLLSRRMHIPIPTLAAVRKELEKLGLITRNKSGAILTEKGLLFVTKSLHINFIQDLSCKECNGLTFNLPPEANQLIEHQNEFVKMRPTPLTNLDQAFGTPETAIRRAYFMLINDDVEGKEILLLGDDDFTSLGIAQLKTDAKITVIDIDERLLTAINEISKLNNFSINCIKADLYNPLPNEFLKKFDVVLTDPPYTTQGLNLFLSRAIAALKEGLGKRIYLAFAHKPPNEQLEVQKTIISLGLTIQQIIPNFNVYEGAEMYGNTTYLAVLVTSEISNRNFNMKFNGEIYTGKLNPTIREYCCLNGHNILVGLTEETTSIEMLKEKGCPICGTKESFTRKGRIKK